MIIVVLDDNTITVLSRPKEGAYLFLTLQNMERVKNCYEDKSPWFKGLLLFKYSL